MKKTITMNLSGIIFHIEEDAYETLNKYLNTIKGYFKDSDGRDEIMADIESRIAEMLSEKLNTGKQAILIADVEEVIAIMGKPEDYAGENSNSETKEETKTGEEAGERKRRRRVFRDPDDKILGGVCSGIANYFDFDPLWLRLGWVVLTLLGGAGILIYIIMWIVLPKATTTAEKLEMRGEAVNINNIKKNIEEEMEHLKKKVKDFEKGAKDAGSSFNKKRTHATDRVVDFTTSVFGDIFRAIGKFLAFILIIVCAILMVLFISSLFGFGDFNNFSFADASTLFFESTNQADLALVGIILLIGIPLVMMIYGGVRAIFGIKQRNKIVHITTSSFWFAGLLILIFVGYSLANEFSEEAKSKQEISVNSFSGNTIFLKLKKDARFDEDENDRKRWNRHNSHSDWGVLETENEKFFYGSPEVDVQQSADSNFHIVVTTYGRAADKKIAIARAKAIKYEITQTDSLIELAPIFDIPKGEKFRAQEVRVVVYVPKGKMVHLANNIGSVIYDIENVTNTWDGDMVNRRWVMTDKGLACVDCTGLDEKNNFEKEHTDTFHFSNKKEK